MCLPCWQRLLSHKSVGRRKGVPEPQLLLFLTLASDAVVLYYTLSNKSSFQMIFFSVASWLFLLPWIGLGNCLASGWSSKNYSFISFLCFAVLVFANSASWRVSPNGCWGWRENRQEGAWGSGTREEWDSCFPQQCSPIILDVTWQQKLTSKPFLSAI